MPNDLRDYMICQAILDSLTLRSASYQYFMYEQYGIHYIAYADRVTKTVQLIDHNTDFFLDKVHADTPFHASKEFFMLYSVTML